jgi:hypothetical protein
MRVAPPVRAWSSGSGPWRAVQQMLYAISSTALAYWIGSHLAGDAVWLLLASLAIGAGAALLAGQWLAVPPQLLGWDGAAWSVGAEASGRQCGHAALMLDLGSWMLVRFTPVGQPVSPLRPAARWLAFACRGDGRATWAALRVALYAVPAAAAGPGAAPAVPDAE